MITTRDKHTSSGSTRAGSLPVERHLTEVYVDGKLVDTIIWNRALLRRLERQGITRDAYIAERAR